MRILYDGDIYSHQVAGGINRYFANLIQRLPIDYFPTLTTTQRRQINIPVHPNLRNLYFPSFRPGRVSRLLQKYFFQAAIQDNAYDLIHPTYYTLLSQQDISSLRKSLVLTVHDMIHELFYPQAPTIEAKALAIKNAQFIICVSENTKKDLLERFSISEKRIAVTHLASEIDISISYGPEPAPISPYFLYVGSRAATYKNFDGLLRAFQKLISVLPDCQLVVVGSPFSQPELQRIAELKLTQNIIPIAYPVDSHLAKLYRCSLALVYPSRYEGFGIPPLEAMACGTCVIAADTSSIPEVVGSAGILFNPDKLCDLAEIMITIAHEPNERDQLIKLGLQQCQNFNWDITVSKTLEVYRTVLAT
jgi:glycosyltransferase involved in cell wall biosynthesis